MIKPEGIIPAMITPFLANQQIDEGGLRSLVQRFIAQGVHGLFCLGTNGEFFTLTYEEKLRVAEIVVEEAAGRVPVYVGTGGISTEGTIRLTRQMEAIGADAVSIITPYFLTFTQEELKMHFQLVAASTALPVMLYNMPNQTSNSLLPATVAELAKTPNIVGIKDSSGRFDVILQYLDSVDNHFSVMAGTDSLILPTLMAGGRGAVAATANFVPEVVVAIYEKWKIGQIDEAEKAQNLLRPIRHAFQLGTLPSALKAAMNMLGLPAGPSRLPVGGLGENQQREIQAMIRQYVELGVLEAMPTA